MIPGAFEPEVLKAFVAVCAHGSMSRAAVEAGRAQSAVSMQMRRLEELIGKPLLRRTGRGVVPTTEGELMLGYARRILSLGEEAAARLGERAVMGNIRIGLAEDVGLSTLPAALGQLRRTFPDLHLDVTVDHNAGLAALWNEGALDVAVGACASFTADPLQVWDVPLHWVHGVDAAAEPDMPLGVIVYAEPCPWRQLMFEALAEAGRDFRVVLTSHSLGAIIAAVENGLGAALVTGESIRPRTMRALSMARGPEDALSVKYGLYAGRRPTEVARAAVAVLRQGVDTLTQRRPWREEAIVWP